MTVTSQDVRRLAKEQGVTTRTIYDRLRREQAAQAEDVPQSQKNRILHELYRRGPARNVEVLRERLDAGGHHVDDHDIVKTLWALSKQEFVTFRESRRGTGRRFSSLYRIDLTPLGVHEHNRLKAEAQARAENINHPAGELPGVVEATPTVNSVVEAEPQPTVTWHVVIEPHQADYVLHEMLTPERFRALREFEVRAARATLLQQAAELADLGGEADLAVRLLEAGTLTPFEAEVAELLTLLGDVLGLTLTPKVAQP